MARYLENELTGKLIIELIMNIGINPAIQLNTQQVEPNVVIACDWKRVLEVTLSMILNLIVGIADMKQIQQRIEPNNENEEDQRLNDVQINNKTDIEPN